MSFRTAAMVDGLALRREAPGSLRRPLVDRLLRRAGDAFWERRYRVRTDGTLHWDTALRNAGYRTLPYASFFAVLDRLRPAADDIVVDIGCGTGRFVACAATLPVRKVVGIEISEPLAAIARANLERMRGRNAPVDIVTAAAQDVDLSHGSVFYLDDVFRAGTLRAVLDNVRAAATAGRPVRLLYAHARHEWMLQQCGWLEAYDDWSPTGGHAAETITFWRSIGTRASGTLHR